MNSTQHSTEPDDSGKRAACTEQKWTVGGHPGDNSGSEWREILAPSPFGPKYIAQALAPHARLIAAAPETAAERDRLLVVNAVLLSACRAMTDAWGIGGNGMAERDALRKIRAAIAAAEGSTAK